MECRSCAPLLSVLRNEWPVVLGYLGQWRFSVLCPRFKPFPETNQFYDTLRGCESVAIPLQFWCDVPCIVSVIFSNDMGFCLNITLPFLISTSIGFAWRSATKLLVSSAPRDQDGAGLPVSGGGSRPLSDSGYELTRLLPCE